MKFSQQFRYVLISGLMAANIAVISVLGISLYQSKREHELKAQIATKNTTTALDQSISHSVDRIELALRAIADELEKQLRTQQALSTKEVEALLETYKKRLPELMTLNVSNASGELKWGKVLSGDAKTTWADREYFIYHRTHDDDSVRISKPRLVRIFPKPIIEFSHRYNASSKQFAGVISATLNVGHFTHLLSQFDLGPKGVLMLRDSTLGLITRFPELANQPLGQFGNQMVSPTLREQINAGAKAGTIHVEDAPDGLERINSFRVLENTPFITIASTASEDYLQNWRIELKKSISIYLAFFITSSIAFAFLIKLLAQSERNIQLLRDNEERLQEAQKQAKLGSWSLDIPTGKLYWSQGVFQLFEIDESLFEATYEAFLNVIHPEDREAVHTTYIDSLKNRTPYEMTHRLLMPSGAIKWVVERCVTEFDEDGTPIKSSGTIQEITDQINAEEQLRIAAVSFNAQEGIVITDAHSVILSVNQAFTKITGYEPDEVIGKTTRILKSDRHPPEFYQAMWQSITQTGSWQGEIWDKRKNGEEYPKWLTISAVRDHQGIITHYVGTHFDITERKRDEEKIRQLAYVDQLTGLANRTTLYNRLDHLLALMARKNGRLALMMIDLDNFKSINDTLGHQTGDQLLIEVSQRLNASVRHSDLVARLGGDEFIIVLPDIDSASDAAHVADKIVHTVSAPYYLQGKEVRTGPSIGICLYPDDAQAMDEIIKKADTAMYHAKSNGRGHYQFFRDDIQHDAENRLAIEADLRDAISKRQFVLYYQPQLDLRSGNIIGVEALIRWQHPEKGMISPMDFIPIAEETGLIQPIGDWVLQEACEQMLRWKSNGIHSIKVSVNLTAGQFLNSSLPDRIQALMQQYDIPPHLLNLEVTESMSMKSPNQTIATMQQLTAYGLGLSIDDFGTGYSSLSYLKLFPVSTLKIDRSFVKDIETDENDAIICDVTVLLAHKLGMDVVAEGVETPEQLKYLRSIGCEKIQGYLISKPLPADQIEFLLKSNLHFADQGSVDLWGEVN